LFHAAWAMEEPRESSLVVKNTFLHFQDDNASDGSYPSGSSRTRSWSPVSWRLVDEEPSSSGHPASKARVVFREQESASTSNDNFSLFLTHRFDVNEFEQERDDRVTSCSSSTVSPGDAVRSDPRSQGRRLPEKDRLAWESGKITTVMVRNIPSAYSQKTLCDELAMEGFAGMFDFLYIPYDFKRGINIGFCFLNFIQADYAVAFRENFDGQHLQLGDARWRKQGGRALQVHPADCQGYDDNLAWLSRTKICNWNHPEFSPIFLQDFHDQALIHRNLPPPPARRLRVAGDDPRSASSAFARQPPPPPPPPPPTRSQAPPPPAPPPPRCTEYDL